MKLRLLISAFLLLVFALGFNAMLTLSSLEKLYIESYVSQYSTVGKDLQRKLEKALGFGKSIEKFVGMDELLKETKQNIENITDKNTAANDISVSVAMSDGHVLYSTNEKLRNTIQLQIKASKAPSQYLRVKDTFIIPLSVSSSLKNEQVATILISFDETPITILLRSVLIRNCKIITAIIAGASLFLLLCFSLILRNADTRNFPKTRISIVIFLVIGISQIIFTGLNTNSFKDYYLQISREKITLLGTLLKQNIEYLLKKGIHVDRLVKMDADLEEIVSAAPELDNIIITDFKGNQLYAASQKGAIDFQSASSGNIKASGKLESDPNYSITLQFQKTEDFSSESEHDRGKIFANISKKVLFGRLKEIVSDSATIVLISFLFLMEMIVFLLILITKNFSSPINKTSRKSKYYNIARPVVFIYIFSYTFSRSFLPLYAENLYSRISWLSKDFVIGVPITVELFFSAIFLVHVGAWIDKKGWHQPFLIGVFLSIIGVFLSGTASGIMELIVYRAISGIGYGFAWMSIQEFILNSTDTTNRAKGLSRLTAGIFAGSICGCAVGAMLAQRIGYEKVFFLSAINMSFSLVFTIVFMKELFIKSAKVSEKTDTFVRGEFFRLVSDRNILLTFMCSLFPYSISMVALLFYGSPIYLKRIGTSQSDIGRVLMIFGLCMIYIAPAIGHKIDRIRNKKDFISIGGLLAGIGMSIFYFFSGYWAIVFAILMFGLSASVSNTARNLFLMDLKISEEVGMSKIMGLYRSADKVGQMLGPVFSGILFGMMTMENSMGILGVIYMLLTLVFILGTQRQKNE